MQKIPFPRSYWVIPRKFLAGYYPGDRREKMMEQKMRGLLDCGIRCTSIPKILRAIQKNGSPLPVFETDDDRTYFVARFPIHPGALQRITKEDSAEPEEPGTKSGPS